MFFGIIVLIPISTRYSDKFSESLTTLTFMHLLKAPEASYRRPPVLDPYGLGSRWHHWAGVCEEGAWMQSLTS